MVFTKRNKKYQQDNFLKSLWKLKIKHLIFYFPMHGDELILNDYLLKNYHMPLKFACIKLLMKSKQALNDYGEVVTFWVDPQDNKLARLITFGTGKIPGSKILIATFS